MSTTFFPSPIHRSLSQAAASSPPHHTYNLCCSKARSGSRNTRLPLVLPAFTSFPPHFLPSPPPPLSSEHSVPQLEPALAAFIIQPQLPLPPPTVHSPYPAFLYSPSLPNSRRLWALGAGYPNVCPPGAPGTGAPRSLPAQPIPRLRPLPWLPHESRLLAGRTSPLF